MSRFILSSVLIIGINFFCLSQTIFSIPNDSCYSDKIRLNTKEKEFIDTVIMVRNYIDSIDDRRIICNSLKLENDYYRLVWDCKYIKVLLEYQDQMNKFSILSYKPDIKNNLIASYFLCDRKTKETVEMMRFKIENKRIVGINIFPNIYNGFVPIEQFDNDTIEMID